MQPGRAGQAQIVANVRPAEGIKTKGWREFPGKSTIVSGVALNATVILASVQVHHKLSIEHRSVSASPFLSIQVTETLSKATVFLEALFSVQFMYPFNLSSSLP